MAAELTPEMEKHIELFVDQYLRSYTCELQDLQDDFKEALEYMAILIIEYTMRVRQQSELSPNDAVVLHKEYADTLNDMCKKDSNPFLLAKLFFKRWLPHAEGVKGG
jgi:hypothetical protein